MAQEGKKHLRAQHDTAVHPVHCCSYASPRCLDFHFPIRWLDSQQLPPLYDMLCLIRHKGSWRCTSLQFPFISFPSTPLHGHSIPYQPLNMNSSRIHASKCFQSKADCFVSSSVSPNLLLHLHLHQNSSSSRLRLHPLLLGRINRSR